MPTQAAEAPHAAEPLRRERRCPPRLIPPAPPPAASGLSVLRPLRALRALRAMRRNALTIWPAQAYEELVLHRRLLRTDAYLISDPAAAHHVLAANSDNYVRPAGARRLVLPWTGRGLLVAEGSAWRRQRRLLAPAFGPRRVEALLPRFAAAGRRMLQRLDARARVNLAAVFQQAALDGFLDAAFSGSLDHAADRIARLHRAYIARAVRVSPLDYLARRDTDFASPISARVRLGRAARVIVNELIAARRAQQPRQADDADVLDVLLAARAPDTGAPLSDVEIGDEVATLLATGFGNSGRLMFWTAYLLSRDSGEQARVREEVSRAPPADVRSLDDLQRWPRLMCVMLEALRLYPPVHVLVRVAEAADEIGGMEIAPGAVIAVSPWVMHRHRALWEHPEVFMPERFAGLRRGGPSDNAYLPFGAGPRVCIGATFGMTEAMLMLAQLFERYETTLDDDRPLMPVSIVTTAPSIEPLFRLTRTA